MSFADKKFHVLILDKDELHAQRIKSCLHEKIPLCRYSQVSDQKEFELKFTADTPDIIIADNSIPDYSVLEAQKFALKKNSDLAFIVIADTVEDQHISDFIINHAVTDYIAKTDLTRLSIAVSKELRRLGAKKKLHIKNEHKVIHSLIASYTKDGIAITDADGKVEWVNNSFTRISGFSVTEMYGKKPGSMLHGKKTDPKTIQFIRRKLAEQVPFTAEILNYSKDGVPYWVRLNIVPYFQDGELTRYVSIQEDITKERENQYKLEKSLQRLNDAQLIGRIADWDYNPYDQTLSWSDQMVELIEYPHEKTPSIQYIISFILQPDRDKVKSAFYKAISQRVPFDFYVDAKTPAGTFKIYRLIAIPVVERGKVMYLKGTLQDATDHKLAERNAQRAFDQLQSISNNMNAAVTRVQIDAGGQYEVLFASEGISKIFEYSPEDVKRDINLLWDVVHPEDEALTVKEVYRRKPEEQETFEQYYRIITPSGKLKWIYSIVTFSQIRSGSLIYDCISVDITENKKDQRFLSEISSVSKIGGWEFNAASKCMNWTPVTHLIHETNVNFEPDLLNAFDFYKEGFSRDRIKERFKNILTTGTSFDEELELVTWKGSDKWVRVKGECEKVDNQVVRVFGTIQDISEMVEKEKKLLNNIKEKNALLGEIHHRVKNNLAIVSGLIQLQLMNDNGSHQSLEDAVSRIQSIAAVHEILYSTDNFSVIDISEYLNKLTEQISNTFPKLNNQISLELNVSKTNLNINQAVPLGLLLNELITNSIKHAFNNREEGKLVIQLHADDDGNLILVYKDNGCGFDREVLNQNKSLGFTLIKSLLEQLTATACYETDDRFKITCKFPNQRNGSQTLI
jgi:PAS domain S-box-containing protein